MQAMVRRIWAEWEDIKQLAIGSCQFAKNTVPLAEMQEGFFMWLQVAQNFSIFCSNFKFQYQNLAINIMPCYF